MKVPDDMQIICDDLKLCGRREMGILIRLRHKYQMITAKQAKAAADEVAAKKKAEEEPEDEDARIDRELEETMKRIEREKKRKEKKEKVLADKSELRKKMSVIATTSLDNDEDMFLSQKLWDEVRKKGFEGVGDKSDDEEGDSDSSEESKGSSSDESAQEEGSENSEEEVDEKQARIRAMDAQMEEDIKGYKQY